MGVPDEEYGYVYEQSNMILGAEDPEYAAQVPDFAVALLGAAHNLIGLVDKMCDERERQPNDDLTSVMVHGEVDGERLTRAEIARFFILLVVAGNETTRNAITHGVRYLTEFPDQRDIWMADIDGVTKTAVEEIVRYSSPVIHMRRTLTAPAVIGGQQLAAGDKVVLYYPSGNRDGTRIVEPDRFDVRRDPNEHVAFGGPGPHYCLGAHLARRDGLWNFLAPSEDLQEDERLPLLIVLFHSLEHGSGLPVLCDDDGLTPCLHALDERSGLGLQGCDRLDGMLKTHG
jgi:cytochrome P450